MAELNVGDWCFAEWTTKAGTEKRIRGPVRAVTKTRVLIASFTGGGSLNNISYRVRETWVKAEFCKRVARKHTDHDPQDRMRALFGQEPRNQPPAAPSVEVSND